MSYVLNANSSSYSNVFIIFEPFHDRDPLLGGDAIAAKIRERLAREVPEARVLVFGAPPISGLGTSAGFKLMVEGSATWTTTRCRPARTSWPPRATSSPAWPACSTASAPARPALRGHRPREGQVDGRAAHRRLRHLAGVRGQLRQRLQPLRPHLAGQRPGRRALPHRRGNRQAAQGPQRRRRHGAAGGGGRGARQPPGRCRSPATTCSRRPRSTASRCPGPAWATPWRAWRS